MGLIPSAELQEWRIATNAIEQAKDGNGKKIHYVRFPKSFFAVSEFCSVLIWQEIRHRWNLNLTKKGAT